MLGFGFLGNVFGRHIPNRLPQSMFRLGFRIVLSLLALRLFHGALGGLWNGD